MTSQRKIEANRRNAQLSTGPKTVEGKRRSRMNAWVHGFRARFVLGPNENPRQFAAHCNRFLQTLRPWDEESTRLVMRIAESQWRLDRGGHYEVQVLRNGPDLKTILRKLTRLTQYEARLERLTEKSLARLERLLKAALRQSIAQTPRQPRQLPWEWQMQLGSFVQKPHFDTPVSQKSGQQAAKHWSDILPRPPTERRNA